MDWPYKEGFAKLTDKDGVKRRFTIRDFFLLRLYAAGLEDPDMDHGGGSCINGKSKNGQAACTNYPIFFCRAKNCKQSKRSSEDSLGGMCSEPTGCVCAFCIKRTPCGNRVLCYSCAVRKENNGTEIRKGDRDMLYVTNNTLQSYRVSFKESDLYRYLEENSKEIARKYRDGSVARMKVFDYMDKMIGAYRLLLDPELNNAYVEFHNGEVIPDEFLIQKDGKADLYTQKVKDFMQSLYHIDARLQSCSHAQMKEALVQTFPGLGKELPNTRVLKRRRKNFRMDARVTSEGNVRDDLLNEGFDPDILIALDADKNQSDEEEADEDIVDGQEDTGVEAADPMDVPQADEDIVDGQEDTGVEAADPMDVSHILVSPPRTPDEGGAGRSVLGPVEEGAGLNTVLDTPLDEADRLHFGTPGGPLSFPCASNLATPMSGRHLSHLNRRSVFLASPFVGNRLLSDYDPFSSRAGSVHGTPGGVFNGTVLSSRAGSVHGTPGGVFNGTVLSSRAGSVHGTPGGVFNGTVLPPLAGNNSTTPLPRLEELGHDNPLSPGLLDSLLKETGFVGASTQEEYPLTSELSTIVLGSTSYPKGSTDDVLAGGGVPRAESLPTD